MAINTNDPLAIRTLIKMLHQRKDAAYGNSWKRRGELTSILANIARKVDRLENYIVRDTVLEDESSIDTTVDLLVYATKYRLFLMDIAPDLAEQLMGPEAIQPFSDHIFNFDALVDQIAFHEEIDASEARIIHQIMQIFEDIHSEASRPSSTPRARFVLATRLSELALTLIILIARKQPAAFNTFQDTEIAFRR